MSVKRVDAQRWMGGAAAPPTEAEVTAKILSILSCYDKIAPADVRCLYVLRMIWPPTYRVS